MLDLPEPTPLASPLTPPVAMNAPPAPAVVALALPPGAPSPETDPDGFMAWCASEAGQEHFRRAGMALMEARVNAERADVQTSA